MKKLSALIMFTLLATAGYYIGNAVAQNNTSAGQTAPDGVLVVEESYGVVVPASADTAAAAVQNQNTQPAPVVNVPAQTDDQSSAQQDNSDNNVVIEETVTEEGYVAE